MTIQWKFLSWWIIYERNQIRHVGISGKSFHLQFGLKGKRRWCWCFYMGLGKKYNTAHACFTLKHFICNLGKKKTCTAANLCSEETRNVTKTRCETLQQRASVLYYSWNILYKWIQCIQFSTQGHIRLTCTQQRLCEFVPPQHNRDNHTESVFILHLKGQLMYTVEALFVMMGNGFRLWIHFLNGLRSIDPCKHQGRAPLSCFRQTENVHATKVTMVVLLEEMTKYTGKLKWNSRLFVIEYESNFHVKA